MVDHPLPTKIPRELPEWAAQDLKYWREAPLAEHARALEAVCAAAMDILAARKQMGLDPPERDPGLNRPSNLCDGTHPMAENDILNLSPTEVAARREVALDTPLDENGWPIGYFDRVVGSMPDLERAPQGEFEKRLPVE